MSDPSRARGSAAATLPTRLILVVAAIVALATVAAAVWRNRPAVPEPPAAATSAAAQQMPAADVGSAIAALEARLKANPNDARGWRMLGWSYYQTERFADAVAAYRRATAIDPASAEGWSALGEAIALAGKGDVPADAAAAFRKALAIDPKDARARYFLAVRRDLAGDHKGAVDDWIALLKDSPQGAPWEQNVRETIAQVAARNRIDLAGRVPPPAAASTAATDAIPGPTSEQMAAASALTPGQQAEMVKGMVDSLAARLKANPRDAEGWMRLMRARMVLGDKAAAAQAYRDARAAFAGDAAAQAQLADAARALGVSGS